MLVRLQASFSAIVKFCYNKNLSSFYQKNFPKVPVLFVILRRPVCFATSYVIDVSNFGLLHWGNKYI